MRGIPALRGVRVVAAALAALVSVSLGAAQTPAKGGEGASALRAVVTIAPLKSLVEPLLPAGSDVRVLMPPGRSEHGYEFSPSDIAALTGADVVVYVGLNLEPRVERALAKPVKGRQVVCFAKVAGLQKSGEPVPNTPEALAKAPERAAGGHEHGAHDHAQPPAGWVDQHLWLDPSLVEQLIPRVRGAVEEVEHEKGMLTPEEQTRLGKAQADLLSRVKGVDEAWKTRLEPLKGRAIVTHHNAFQRPAERYGLGVAAAIRESEGSEPTPGDIARVIAAMNEKHVKAIFVEPQFDSKAADRVAAQAHAKVGRLDPLGDGDWFKMMTDNLDSLVTNLKD